MNNLPSDLPEILNQFKMSAPQIVKGGIEVKNLALVRYPSINLKDCQHTKEIVFIWNEWWNNTSWAADPTTSNPRWNSITRTGYIWTLFGEAALNPDGRPYVYCLNCGFILQHPTVRSIGTKHLHNHIDTRSCKATLVPIYSQTPGLSPQLSQLPNTRTPESIPLYSIQVFEKELVRVVIDNNWSFRTVERPSFQRFLHFLRPDTTSTTRFRFQTMFQTQATLAKESLLNDLSPATKLSIALDAWSANNHLSFLAIKAYYINDQWRLKDKLLDFIPMRGSHTGTSMATEVLQVLSNTSTKRRLLAITCDNASNNGTLTRTIQTKLKDEDIHWSSQENAVPCLAHIINLVVQDIIQHLKISALDEDGPDEALQRQYVDEVQNQMSVPNSLRKVRIRSAIITAI
jgi:hypothetical protein